MGFFTHFDGSCLIFRFLSTESLFERILLLDLALTSGYSWKRKVGGLEFFGGSLLAPSDPPSTLSVASDPQFCFWWWFLFTPKALLYTDRNASWTWLNTNRAFQVPNLIPWLLSLHVGRFDVSWTHCLLVSMPLGLAFCGSERCGLTCFFTTDLHHFFCTLLAAMLVAEQPTSQIWKSPLVVQALTIINIIFISFWGIKRNKEKQMKEKLRRT